MNKKAALIFFRRFLVLSFVAFVASGCTSIMVASEMAKNLGEALSSPFYEYNYASNLDKYHPESWRPNSKQDVKKLPKKQRENWKNYKVGTPYEIDGTWYFPKEEPRYNEVGEASWYGADFHNKKTANGERFNKNEITAAHRTLPLPSVVRVTNLENGKSMLVRVNDRGPFAKNRIIDVSERVAKELDFHGQGTTKVRVQFDVKETRKLFYDPWNVYEKPKPKQEYAGHVTSPKVTTIGAKTIGATKIKDRPEYYQEHFVQAGAYSTWDNASSVTKGLRKVAPVHIQEGDYRGQIVYRVRLGPFDSKEKAGKVLDQVAMMGFQDAVVLGK